jgi:hypothetical protein
VPNGWCTASIMTWLRTCRILREFFSLIILSLEKFIWSSPLFLFFFALFVCLFFFPQQNASFLPLLLFFFSSRFVKPVTFKVDYAIPTALVGRLIGKRGARIKEITKASAAHLEVRKTPTLADGSEAEETAVCIEGLFHETQVCVRLFFLVLSYLLISISLPLSFFLTFSPLSSKDGANVDPAAVSGVQDGAARGRVVVRAGGMRGCMDTRG